MKAVNTCGLKRAALINDLSCFGKCSLSVSMPILSSYGIETVPLPTALLSTHTGGFTGYVVQDTTEAMRAFAAHWKQVGVQFDCIATGYCCSPEQIRLAAEFIRSFADGRTLVVVDPVLGDHGRLYSGFTDAHVDAMRELCSLADVITPNRTEAALLSGLACSSADETLLYAQQVKNTILTSVRTETGIGYLARLDGGIRLVLRPFVELTLHGAGDVFTSALCGELLMVDVAAAEPCEILWLDLVPMLQQQNTAASWYPKFLHNLLLLSMQKNLALSQRIRCTTPKSARGRLLTYLSAQAVRAGSTHFSIPFDRQQLADYLNLDRSALSKELGKMRDDGLIRCRKNEFELCGTE